MNYLTQIESNGSKWAWEAPDNIEQLLARLQSETLDPMFEEYGNFVSPARKAHHQRDQSTGWQHVYTDAGPVYPDHPDALHFWGNFQTYSHVFSIYTDDPALIERLTAAIRANQATDAYQAAKARVAQGGTMIAPQLLNLLQAWRASEDAYGSHDEPAASKAERFIIGALNNAKHAGMLLLVDDLTAALSHVDGCSRAYDARRQELSETREAARAALRQVGISVYSHTQMQDLADQAADPAMQVFLQCRADYLREMGE